MGGLEGGALLSVKAPAAQVEPAHPGRDMMVPTEQLHSFQEVVVVELGAQVCPELMLAVPSLLGRIMCVMDV
jgi:hypothetical protein